MLPFIQKIPNKGISRQVQVVVQHINCLLVCTKYIDNVYLTKVGAYIEQKVLFLQINASNLIFVVYK